MKICEIMTVPRLCTIKQTIRQVAHNLQTYDIDTMPVTDLKGNLLGLIGKKQLYQAIAAGACSDTPVEKWMTRDIILATPETDVKLAYKLQADSIVVAENGKVIGIVEKLDKYYYTLSHNNMVRQMEATIESVYNGLLGIDNQNRITIFNKSAARIFGIAQEKVIGQNYSQVFPHGNLDEVLHSQQSAPNQKITYKGKTLLSNRTPIWDGNNIIGAIAVIQDISELENISQELEYTKKLKAELEAIIEASFDSIFVTDEKGTILRVNQAYSRISGIKREDIIGRNMYDLVNEGFYDYSATVIVIAEHKPVTFTQKIKTGKTILVTGNPIFDEKGQLLRVLTNGRDITELNRLKQEVEQAHTLSKHYEKQLEKATYSGDMIVDSPKMRKVLNMVVRLAKVDSTVLIYGESGVGKELIARELQKNGPRKDKPFITLNCAAIPETLLESELFGYESGAFTGAQKGGKMGILEMANGGTLFLDEIGELPLALQAKILRVIQEEEVIRVGGTFALKIDVRIITATNRNLWEMVQNGLFREDLYYRLNVVPIYVPPLRDRTEDIPGLVQYFVKTINQKYGMDKRIDDKLINKLIYYDWPGNVRELKNVIERAVVTNADPAITVIKIDNNSTEGEVIIKQDNKHASFKQKVEAYEKELLAQYIKTYKTSRKVAQALGMSQSSVMRKVTRYGLKLGGE